MRKSTVVKSLVGKKVGWGFPSWGGCERAMRPVQEVRIELKGPPLEACRSGVVRSDSINFLGSLLRVTAKITVL